MSTCRRAIAALALLLPLSSGMGGETPGQAEAEALIRRVLPAHAGRFTVEMIPAAASNDVFEVEGAGGRVTLRGNTPVAVASALNWYLKNIARCDVSWCGDQLALPDPLPPVPQKARVVNPHRWRVYFNYCTLSYTASWWDWARWQREIDFMALNGINMPLAPTGIEAVWYQTLLKCNFTDEEARAFLVGPAFFAWQWMQNIEGHGGPLPKSWIDRHADLARQILQRERALGMTPIQQGFSGHVPRLLKQKFPDASMVQQPGWCGFPGVMQLDPLDPLFAKIGRTFLEEEIKLFGTSHVYGCDPFHESSPPKPGDDYLSRVGTAIIGLMTNVDPRATWAMQAWSIRKPIATAVPKDHLLVLDLGGGSWRGHKFWGYDFIVGQLHNFGGRINLHGDLASVADNPFAAAKKEAPNAMGTGLFMEGTSQNPVFYNLYFDMVWRDLPVEVGPWLDAYARRRYGADSAPAREAWRILQAGPYRRGTSGTENSSIIAARPALSPRKSGPNSGFGIPYEPQQLVRAWELLLQDAPRLKDSDAYRFDVADVGRQVLSNLGQELHEDVVAAFAAKDKAVLATACKRFQDLLADVDQLLATRPEYHFGKWVADARRWGTTEAESDLYEKNASMLVTLWGPELTPGIFDYSWREWSGLIGSYYLPRWKMFHDFLQDDLAKGAGYSEAGLASGYGRPAFRANAILSRMADWEIAWVNSRKDLPAKPAGDAVALAQQFWEKYRPMIAEAYGEERAAKADRARREREFPDFGTLIGTWKADQFSTQWGTVDFDVSKQLTAEGPYDVRFQYERGGHRLHIRSVALLKDDVEVQRDAHVASTGNAHSNNVFAIKLDALAFQAKYVLRAEVRTEGGTDSSGSVWLKQR